MLAKTPAKVAARLPINYVAAREAIAECAKVDECKSWADKAMAIASYAKQANDDELEKIAKRIKARAIRRGGELLAAIKPDKGGRTRVGTGPSSLTRKATAKQAGLSPRQAKQMLRTSNIPKDVFENAVESDDPPSAEKLGDLGTKKNVVDLKGRDPEDFKAATQLIGVVQRFKKDIAKIDMVAAKRGADVDELEELLADVQEIERLLGALA